MCIKTEKFSVFHFGWHRKRPKLKESAEKGKRRKIIFRASNLDLAWEISLILFRHYVEKSTGLSLRILYVKNW